MVEIDGEFYCEDCAEARKEKAEETSDVNTCDEILQNYQAMTEALKSEVRADISREEEYIREHIA